MFMVIDANRVEAYCKVMILNEVLKQQSCLCYKQCYNCKKKKKKKKTKTKQNNKKTNKQTNKPQNAKFWFKQK